MMRAERLVRRLAQSRIPTGVIKFTGSALSPAEVDRVMDEWRRQQRQTIIPAPQVTSFESRKPLLPWHRRRSS